MRAGGGVIGETPEDIAQLKRATDEARQLLLEKLILPTLREERPDLIDGKEAMTRFLHLLANEPALANVPIMVDSSKFEIIEAALSLV